MHDPCTILFCIVSQLYAICFTPRSNPGLDPRPAVFGVVQRLQEAIEDDPTHTDQQVRDHARTHMHARIHTHTHTHTHCTHTHTHTHTHTNTQCQHTKVIRSVSCVWQMYSCGSLAPKMRRGGCMDTHFQKPAEPWEKTEGLVNPALETRTYTYPIYMFTVRVDTLS